MYPILKHKAVYEIVIVALLFSFFAPVVSTSVSPYLLHPWRSQCGEWILGHPGPGQVFTSISFVVFGLAVAGTVHEGAFGLVFVPNNGWDTIQFPPLGLGNIMLCG